MKNLTFKDLSNLYPDCHFYTKENDSNTIYLKDSTIMINGIPRSNEGNPFAEIKDDNRLIINMLQYNTPLPEKESVLTQVNQVICSFVFLTQLFTDNENKLKFKNSFAHIAYRSRHKFLNNPLLFITTGIESIYFGYSMFVDFYLFYEDEKIKCSPRFNVFLNQYSLIEPLGDFYFDMDDITTSHHHLNILLYNLLKGNKLDVDWEDFKNEHIKIIEMLYL